MQSRYIKSLNSELQEHGQNQRSDFRWLMLSVILVFWSLFAIFYLFIKLLHSFGIFPYGEYAPTEQISKYYLLITILISTHAYITQNLRTRVKLSICFLLLGLVMYLSESNMISSNAQPVFGFIILVYTFFLLARSRAWIVFLLLLMGCVSISMGVIADFVHDYFKFGRPEFVETILPEPIINYFRRHGEERFDVTGAAFICLSMIIYSLDSLRSFFRNNKYATFGFLFSAGMIAIGNSFLHWQQKPGPLLTLISLSLSITGFLGLISISRNTNKKHAVMGLPTQQLFSLFLFSFFVVLPAIFGRENDILSLVLWLPTIIFLGIFLYVQHPSRKKTQTKFSGKLIK